MSRIGKKPIAIPAGVTITVKEANLVEVSGPKGTLANKFDSRIAIEINGNECVLTRPDESKLMRTLHGTTRALLNNMVVGVSEGFSKKLTIVGIGYRAAMRGTTLVLNMGYSHEVLIEAIDGVTYKVVDTQVGSNKSQSIEVSGIDKQKVGQMAAEIRAVREPEPYLGKGIKYENEVIIRKEGTRAGKK